MTTHPSSPPPRAPKSCVLAHHVLLFASAATHESIWQIAHNLVGRSTQVLHLADELCDLLAILVVRVSGALEHSQDLLDELVLLAVLLKVGSADARRWLLEVSGVLRVSCMRSCERST